MKTDSYSDFEDEIVKDVCEYLFRHEIDYEKYDELHLSNSGNIICASFFL